MPEYNEGISELGSLIEFDYSIPIWEREWSDLWPVLLLDTQYEDNENE